MKVLIYVLLALFCGSYVEAQEDKTTETKVQNWLKEKRNAFYADRVKDPALQTFLRLYDKLEKEGTLCPFKYNVLKISAQRTNEASVRVNWQASTNNKVEGYSLERSFGKDGPYERVYYRSVNNSDTTTQLFQYLDNNSYSQKSFYRVVQVMALGKRVEKKAVAEGYDTDLTVKAYPNPSNRHFTLAVHSKLDEPLQITVVDVMGRIVEQKNKLPANQLVEIGSKYHSGTFFVEILQGGKTKQIKLEKRDIQTR